MRRRISWNAAMVADCPTSVSPALTVPVLAPLLAIRRVIGLNRIVALDCCYAALAILTVMLSTLTIAHAHDHARPELNGWYESLRSGKGPCCDGSDAKRVDDADWESKDGHYRVRIDGEWIDVPREAVVDGPNRAGRTMVWPYYEDGHPKARCFMPGSMS
jgi:hypothetical protein